jgi:hypothetical protein
MHKKNSMDELLEAIVVNNRKGVSGALHANAELATCLIPKAKLYNFGICHWIYIGDTALHLAAAGYRVAIVRSLLAAGANVNAAENHRRSTPLHYAADGFIAGPAWDPENQVKTIKCLLNRGADINFPDKNGATPLHRAVRTRCAAAVRCLLACGCDPTLKNKPGSMAFHLAVQNTGRGGSGSAAAIDQQRQIIEEFLARGMSPELRTDSGKSVRDCARTPWIKELLSQ